MPLSAPFDGFDWDDGNGEKCQKHGLSIEEIESLLLGPSVYTFEDVVHSNTEIRYISIGQAGTGRRLFVVFTIRNIDERRLIRPVSARCMHVTEAVRHERNRQAIEETPGSEN